MTNFQGWYNNLHDSSRTLKWANEREASKAPRPVNAYMQSNPERYDHRKARPKVRKEESRETSFHGSFQDLELCLHDKVRLLFSEQNDLMIMCRRRPFWFETCTRWRPGRTKASTVHSTAQQCLMGEGKKVKEYRQPRMWGMLRTLLKRKFHVHTVRFRTPVLGGN